MPYYRHVGDVPRKRHSYARVDGDLLFEELMGQEGFSSESSLLYHRRSPSAIVAIEAVAEPEQPVCADVPLTPRHLRTTALEPGGDAVRNRVLLLANDDVRISYFAATTPSDLYRDAVGDQLAYMQSGEGVLETSFGALTVATGDYVVVPRATTHRWRVEGAEPLTGLILEARQHVRIPAKYVTDRGQLREGAPFSERDLRGPGEPIVCDGDYVPVLVRNRSGLSRLVHANHPFDVVGWDGCVWPFAFSIHDFEPIVGARHQPPPVHQTFEGSGFVVCSFVPRPYDFGDGAVKVPYHHANVDSDEVLFYSAGDFMSRSGSGIGVGSISYHPSGFVHGPQPGSVEASREATRTEEVAVMVDTFAPLALSDAARAISDPDYPFTWARGTA
jgi:homogentisate 1,2-dioxygenase